MEDLEAQTIRKVSARLIPFLMICYFIAYLDRVNVGFAALTMNKSLGLTATMFGFGSGVFFLTYFVFEVPSNLALDRFGARKWIARIMISWGILSGLMAFIPHIARATGLGNDVTFYLVRLLLGAAEAGFFPGIIFYLTLWYPSVYRGRVIGAFMAAIPLSSAIGSPISGMILGMHGIWGLEGWQWLFIIEAAPAVVLAFVTYFYLTDRPTDATWLAPDERSWLTGRLDAERRQREAVHQISVLQSLYNPRVWALALVYFGLVACNYGVAFWLPQIIKAFGLSNFATGWVTAIPYAIGAAFMVWYGYRSDSRGERKFHTAVALAIAAAGIAGWRTGRGSASGSRRPAAGATPPGSTRRPGASSGWASSTCSRAARGRTRSGRLSATPTPTAKYGRATPCRRSTRRPTTTARSTWCRRSRAPRA